MDQYLSLLDRLLHATPRPDRTGTGTRALFGQQMRFDLQAGFPLLTTKQIFWKGVVHELLWFLRGDTNIKYLQDNGVHIWDEWADENGNLGPVYGEQWRHWSSGDGNNYREVDQIANVVKSLRDDPYGRRHIVTAWNPADIPNMKLPPCHCLFQFFVRPAAFHERWCHYNGSRNRVSVDRAIALSKEMDECYVPTLMLDCQLYQRSADTFLGVPFNIASYALLTHMMAHVLGYIPGEFVWTGGDVHLYSNHVEQATEQLKRESKKLPTLTINRTHSFLEDFTFDSFTLEGYNPDAPIAAPVAV